MEEAEFSVNLPRSFLVLLFIPSPLQALNLRLISKTRCYEEKCTPGDLRLVTVFSSFN